MEILIVDDNPLNLKLAGDILQAHGYVVTTACDAETAETMLAERLPDLILLDLALPGMDGLAYCRLLKANPTRRHIPVVAFTAHAMKGDEQKAIDAGCSGYITKPIDTRGFPRQIATVLSAAKPPEPKLSVLVVEDDRIDLKLMNEVLIIKGHVVFGNTSAEEAARAVARATPDVILLDLQLPGIDGLTFVKHLKAQPETRGIPIVAVTAFSDLYREAELLAAGCAAFFVKPVDTRAIARRLEQVAGLARVSDKPPPDAGSKP